MILYRRHHHWGCHGVRDGWWWWQKCVLSTRRSWCVLWCVEVTAIVANHRQWRQGVSVDSICFGWLTLCISWFTLCVIRPITIIPMIITITSGSSAILILVTASQSIAICIFNLRGAGRTTVDSGWVILSTVIDIIVIVVSVIYISCTLWELRQWNRNRRRRITRVDRVRLCWWPWCNTVVQLMSVKRYTINVIANIVSLTRWIWWQAGIFVSITLVCGWQWTSRLQWVWWGWGWG